MNDTNNDFFQKQSMQQDAQTQAPEMISVGEKQYSQDELQQLVGLGEVASTLETKWNTPIESLMPSYTKATQENAELRTRNEEYERKLAEATQAKVATGQQLTQEEEARLIREQAEKFGLLTEDKFESKYQERRDAERNQELANRLIKDTESFLEKQASEGKPKADPRDMLTYMDERGISDYESAYKLKYEQELDTWKMKQLTSNRPSGMYTQSQSTAGAKEPVERQLTSANLTSAIDETLSRYR